MTGKDRNILNLARRRFENADGVPSVAADYVSLLERALQCQEALLDQCQEHFADFIEAVKRSSL